MINGKTIRGALNYNEKKVRESKAVLLHAENFPKATEELSFRDKLSYFTMLTSLVENVQFNCVHISLNFDPSESINNNQLIAIAQSYMDKVGFGEQPFLVYRHTDAAHPHAHIVTTNIRADRSYINLHNLAKIQSEIARKAVEKQFNLIPAESKKAKLNASIKPVPETVIYGKSELKAALSNVVRSVVDEYKYTTLEELNAILALYNVTAYRGEEGSKMYEKKGLSYSVLDSNGNKTGVPIKASSIYSKPKLSYLEEQFELNKKKRSRFREPLKKKH